MNQIIIQGIGYLALFFNLLSYQRNKRSSILFCLIISCILFCVHFSLLQAWTGAATNILGALRAILFYQKDTKVWAQHPLWMYGFMAAFLVAGLITWTSYVSLLAILAGFADTFGLWRKGTRSIRFLKALPQKPQ